MSTAPRSFATQPPASSPHPDPQGTQAVEPIDLSSESVAGEEDPGAALTMRPVAEAASDQAPQASATPPVQPDSTVRPEPPGSKGSGA